MGKEQILNEMYNVLTRDDLPLTRCDCGRTECGDKCIFCLAEELLGIKESYLMKDNHVIGMELESYCNILEYRGFNEEARELSGIASRLK